MVAADEILLDSLVFYIDLDDHTTLYHSSASTLKFIMGGNPNSFLFKELISILPQEEQLRQDKSILCVANEAFASNLRGKNKKTCSKGKPKLVA